MLTQTITFMMADGETEVTDTFYFGLSEADVIRMQLTAPGNDMRAYIQQVVASNDGQQIMDTFEDIVRKSYGVKTADGRGFKHSKELSEDFMATDAYNKLFIRLVTDAEFAGDFVNGIMPANLDQLTEEAAKAKTATSAVPVAAQPAPVGTPAVAPQAATDETVTERKLGDFSQEELLEMPQEQFDELVGTDPTKWPNQVMQVAYLRKTRG